MSSGGHCSAYQRQLFAFQLKSLNVHPGHIRFVGSEVYAILRGFFREKKIEMLVSK